MPYLKTIIGIVLIFGMVSCQDREIKTKKANAPNIVFIFIDDLGYGDLSCYGNSKIETPNFDRVAENGIKFTQFYANAPVCSPSRVAFITGQYPFRRNIHGVVASREKNRERRQADYLDTIGPLLPRILKKIGYKTAHFGKWHMGGGRDIKEVPYPTDYGFDKSLVGFEGIGDRILDNSHFLSDMSAKLGKGKIIRTDKHRITKIYVDSALAFINQNKKHPFYLNLFPGDVHDPFKPTEEATAKFRNTARDEEEAKFFAVLHETDKQIGRFIDSLETMGLMKNTVMIVSSDNGPTDWPRYYKEGRVPPSSQGNLRGRKWSLYEGGIRVPFMVQWNGKIQKQQMDSTTVGVVMDLFPTILSFAGMEKIPVEEVLDGINLKPAIMNRPIERDEPIYWFFPNVPLPGNPEYITPKLAMRSDHWKFLVNEDGSEPQLYNLDKDLTETNNLKDKYPDKVAKFTEQTLEWYNENVLFVD